MNSAQTFAEGIKLISSLYTNKLNGQPFNRDQLISTVTTLAKIGFNHSYNEGTLAILTHKGNEITHTIKIGRQAEMSFFEHTTSYYSPLSSI